jgi:hypothetical protein
MRYAHYVDYGHYGSGSIVNNGDYVYSPLCPLWQSDLKSTMAIMKIKEIIDFWTVQCIRCPNSVSGN